MKSPNRISSRIVGSLSLFIVTTSVQASEVGSALIGDDYSFIVAGHAYGRPYGPNIGIYQKFLDVLRDRRNDVDFVIFTGDIVRVSNGPSWNQVLRELDEIGLPYYLVMGNHDISETSTSVFNEKYGGSFYHFEVGSDHFLILDTHLASNGFTPEQLELAKSVVKNSKGNLFVFFHELLWLNDVKYRKLHANRSGKPYFQADYWPSLQRILAGTDSSEVFVIAGDIGATSAAMPAFFDKSENVRLIASGMGYPGRETYLLISSIQGNVGIDVVPLSPDSRVDAKALPVETYNTQYLEENFAPNVTLRSLLGRRLLDNMASHRYFILALATGVAAVGVFALIIAFVRQRTRHKQVDRGRS